MIDKRITPTPSKKDYERQVLRLCKLTYDELDNTERTAIPLAFTVGQKAITTATNILNRRNRNDSSRTNQ